MSARPFIKWAGGKTSILPELLELLPKKFATYHEPFLGGGAMFFGLMEKYGNFSSFLSDTNIELVNAWRMVQKKPVRLLNRLSEFKPGEQAYYRVRKSDPDSASERAARTIYLNKTGFNGLYRVNRSGGFNVPWGGKRKGKVWLDEENIRACSKALRNSYVDARSFQTVLERVQAEDFVYFDPPYYPVKKDSFRAYSSAGFGHVHHVRLRDISLELKRRGVHVMISNSSAPEVFEIYAGKQFDIQEVQAARSVNSKGDGRGKVTDLIIR